MTLNDQIEEILRDAANHIDYKVECPECHKEIEAHKGTNVCPHCTTQFEVELNLSNTNAQ